MAIIRRANEDKHLRVYVDSRFALIRRKSIKICRRGVLDAEMPH